MGEDEKTLDAHGLNFNKPLDEAALEKQRAANNVGTNDIKTHSNESVSFPTNCHNCGFEGVTRMCVCEIPFFKEIIVMAFTCEHCGARSSDVKTGGGIAPQGKKMVLKVDGEEDMNRDVFKSETATVIINEIGLEITQGSLGAVYSTVEGLFGKLIETFCENNPFVKGDSAESDFKNRFDEFIAKLEKYKEGKEKFTLIFDDPLDNSWLYSPYGYDKDPRLASELYTRTEEQDIDLGINYLKEMEAKEQAEK